MKKIIALSLLLAFTKSVHAALVFSWDANSESNISGYKLYYATFSLLGLAPTDVQGAASVGKIPFSGLTTTRGVDPSNSTLTPSFSLGSTYYFRLTAYNSSDLESEFNVNAAGAPDQVSAVVNAGGADSLNVKKRVVSPNGDNANDTLSFGTNASEAEISDVRGRAVRRIMGGGNGLDLAWDVRDEGGRVVESGLYIAKVTDTAGGVHFQTVVVAR